jgi:tubulin polyglutamylase TTLL6/13
MWEIWW